MFVSWSLTRCAPFLTQADSSGAAVDADRRKDLHHNHAHGGTDHNTVVNGGGGGGGGGGRGGGGGGGDNDEGDDDDPWELEWTSPHIMLLEDTRSCPPSAGLRGTLNRAGGAWNPLLTAQTCTTAGEDRAEDSVMAMGGTSTDEGCGRVDAESQRAVSE
jgi:hypothetical protein